MIISSMIKTNNKKMNTINAGFALNIIEGNSNLLMDYWRSIQLVLFKQQNMPYSESATSQAGQFINYHYVVNILLQLNASNMSFLSELKNNKKQLGFVKSIFNMNMEYIRLHEPRVYERLKSIQKMVMNNSLSKDDVLNQHPASINTERLITNHESFEVLEDKIVNKYNYWKPAKHKKKKKNKGKVLNADTGVELIKEKHGHNLSREEILLKLYNIAGKSAGFLKGKPIVSTGINQFNRIGIVKCGALNQKLLLSNKVLEVLNDVNSLYVDNKIRPESNSLYFNICNKSNMNYSFRHEGDNRVADRWTDSTHDHNNFSFNYISLKHKSFLTDYNSPMNTATANYFNCLKVYPPVNGGILTESVVKTSNLILNKISRFFDVSYRSEHYINNSESEFSIDARTNKLLVDNEKTVLNSYLNRINQWGNKKDYVYNRINIAGNTYRSDSFNQSSNAAINQRTISSKKFVNKSDFLRRFEYYLSDKHELYDITNEPDSWSSKSSYKPEQLTRQIHHTRMSSETVYSLREWKSRLGDTVTNYSMEIPNRIKNNICVSEPGTKLLTSILTSLQMTVAKETGKKEVNMNLSHVSKEIDVALKSVEGEVLKEEKLVHIISKEQGKPGFLFKGWKSWAKNIIISRYEELNTRRIGGTCFLDTRIKLISGILGTLKMIGIKAYKNNYENYKFNYLKNSSDIVPEETKKMIFGDSLREEKQFNSIFYGEKNGKLTSDFLYKHVYDKEFNITRRKKGLSVWSVLDELVKSNSHTYDEYKLVYNNKLGIKGHKEVFLNEAVHHYLNRVLKSINIFSVGVGKKGVNVSKYTSKDKRAPDSEEFIYHLEIEEHKSIKRHRIVNTKENVFLKDIFKKYMGRIEQSADRHLNIKNYLKMQKNDLLKNTKGVINDYITKSSLKYFNYKKMTHIDIEDYYAGELREVSKTMPLKDNYENETIGNLKFSQYGKPSDNKYTHRKSSNEVSGKEYNISDGSYGKLSENSFGQRITHPKKQEDTAKITFLHKKIFQRADEVYRKNKLTLKYTQSNMDTSIRLADTAGGNIKGQNNGSEYYKKSPDMIFKKGEKTNGNPDSGSQAESQNSNSHNHVQRKEQVKTDVNIPGKSSAKGADVDIDKIMEQVYSKLERKLAFERKRRGMF